MAISPETAQPAERIVLLTAESAGNAASLEGFIEANAGRIALVVVSDIGGGIAGVLKEAQAIWSRSGPGFLPYLYGSWIHYYLAVRMRHLVAKAGVPVRRRLPLPALCAQHDIPCIREADVNSAAVREQVAAVNPDFLVSFVFDQILRDELIAIPTSGVLNVHAAFLPECRGPFPVFFSALEGDTHTGVTIHEIVDRGIDSGPILHRSLVPMAADASILYREHLLHAAAVRPLTAILDDPASAAADAVDQDAGSYFSFPSRENIADAKARGILLITADDLARVSRETYAQALGAIDGAAGVSSADPGGTACQPSALPL